MYIHRENALKRPSTYIILFYIERDHLKKKNFNVHHETHQIAHQNLKKIRSPPTNPGYAPVLTLSTNIVNSVVYIKYMCGGLGVNIIVHLHTY